VVIFPTNAAAGKPHVVAQGFAILLPL